VIEKWFFEKFEQLADAPGSVANIRELVLNLAVQGRLSSAFPNDGIVPSVLEFRERAAALANSLGLRLTKEAVDETEPLFDIPSQWSWMALADIGAAQTGTTPSKADHDAFNGDIPFIKPADILPNAINYSNESLTRHGAESGSRLAPSGSLLMVCIGTIGKCNLIERECAFNQQINALTPVAAVDSRYLLIVARSGYFQDAAWKKSSSTTIAILNKGKWLSIPVPIPPPRRAKTHRGESRRADGLVRPARSPAAGTGDPEVGARESIAGSLCGSTDAGESGIPVSQVV